MPNQSRPAPKGVFITGTDTHVGKTVATAALGMALEQTGSTVGIVKPVETGTRDAKSSTSDGDRFRAVFAHHRNVDVVSLYRFPSPVAPLDAMRISQQPIDMQTILNTCRTVADRHEYMLVEGAGGLLVPLTETQDVRHLIKLLGLPCLVVSRTSLGSINQTRLTLLGLQQAGIPIAGVLLNHTQADTTGDARQQTTSTVTLIRELVDVPVWGPLPFQPHLHVQWEEGITTLAKHPAMRELMKTVRGND